MDVMRRERYIAAGIALSAVALTGVLSYSHGLKTGKEQSRSGAHEITKDILASIKPSDSLLNYKGVSLAADASMTSKTELYLARYTVGANLLSGKYKVLDVRDEKDNYVTRLEGIDMDNPIITISSVADYLTNHRTDFQERKSIDGFTYFISSGLPNNFDRWNDQFSVTYELATIQGKEAMTLTITSPDMRRSAAYIDFAPFGPVDMIWLKSSKSGEVPASFIDLNGLSEESFELQRQATKDRDATLDLVLSKVVSKDQK